METTASKRRILVPIDGSELAAQAIPYAAQVGGPDATLYLLRVMPNVGDLKGFWGDVIATAAEVDELATAEARSDLATAQEYVPEGIAVETMIANGDPADQIIQTALRQSVDFIVMASHGRGAVGRWTFGSIADRVARESLLPVIIFRPELKNHRTPSLRRVVVALDGSEIAMRAIPVAQDLARQHGLPVNLVEVVNPTRALFPTVAMSGPVADEVYEEALHTEESAAEKTLGAAAAPLKAAGVAVTSQILIGAIVPAIEATVHAGDLVVITSHGRGGFRRWLLGSVAERLIHDGLAPVLLMPAHERALARQPQPAEAFATASAPI